MQNTESPPMVVSASSGVEPLLDVATVASILGVARSTVYQLVKSGKLEPVALPVRKTRFRQRDILAFIGEGAG